ncbi:MAG: hypothetical protein ACYCZ6_06365 [Polaromonas sp.]
MVEYLSFEEVAAVLNCSNRKVRQVVLEDKTLKATRITFNGMVLDAASPAGHFIYDLDFCCHLSEDGAITSDIYENDASGKTVLTRTLDVGCLRVERSDLDAYMRDSEFFKRQQVDLGCMPATHWPWGNHHTELLGHLDAAARRFWVNYDPSDATTAPTKVTVSEWLQTARKVSKTMADSIASMLRPDDLPTGPRK